LIVVQEVVQVGPVAVEVYHHGRIVASVGATAVLD
jgi:hypothetical protein